MTGSDSQVGGSVTTNLIPLPSIDGGQMVMAEVQINNLQGDISSATSGVVSASEADEIANQIIENNIKNQQEQIAEQQEETGEYADQTTLVAYLGFVPGFDSYRTAELPKQNTWYEPKEIYSSVVMNDNINAFYDLASTNINNMTSMIQGQPNLQEE
jgi:ABC-type antimicrobial peptide transport system permease subunit